MKKFVTYYVAGDMSLFDTAGEVDKYNGVPAYWPAVVDKSVTGKALELSRKLESSPDNLVNVYCFPLLDDDPSRLPPCYVLGLTRDEMRDDAAHYAQWLEHNGVQVEYVEEPLANHRFMFLYGKDECALRHLKSIAEFVRRKLEQ